MADKSNTYWEVNNWDDSLSVSKNAMDSGVEDTEDKLLRVYNEKTTIVIDKIKEMGLPKEGEQIRCITKRSFNVVAFIKHITDIEPIEDAIFVIYSINHEAAKIINDLVTEGKIKKVKILMSTLRNKAHRKKEQLTKDFFVNNPNIELIFLQSHAKIFAMQTKSNYYIIEGSGNLSYNSRIEQYVIDNSKQIYQFTVNWVNEIVEYLTEKKQIVFT